MDIYPPVDRHEELPDDHQTLAEDPTEVCEDPECLGARTVQVDEGVEVKTECT